MSNKYNLGVSRKGIVKSGFERVEDGRKGLESIRPEPDLRVSKRLKNIKIGPNQVRGKARYVLIVILFLKENIRKSPK